MPGVERTLILGGSGVLGRHLRARAGLARALVTFRSRPIDGGVHFDARQMRLKDRLLRGEHGISHAFILYGETSLDACARDPGGTARINVESVRVAIDDLLDAGVKPVFTSSDAVFDGSRGLWREDDAPNPVLTYGRQKLEVERYLAESGAGLTVRLSKIVSSLPEDRTPLTDWIDQIEREDPIRCATDLVFSPVDAGDAADALMRLADGPFTGLYHLSGPDVLSRLELFELLLDAVRRRRTVHPNVITCRARDLSFVEPRPLDVSMNADRLRAALGCRFRSMAGVCAQLAEHHIGRLGSVVSA